MNRRIRLTNDYEKPVIFYFKRTNLKGKIIELEQVNIYAWPLQGGGSSFTCLLLFGQLLLFLI